MGYLGLYAKGGGKFMVDSRMHLVYLGILWEFLEQQKIVSSLSCALSRVRSNSSLESGQDLALCARAYAPICGLLPSPLSLFS